MLCLCNDAKFTLLDEPYNSLSPIMIKKVNEQIKHYSSQKGVIMTDHNYKNVIEVSNQLYLINNNSTKRLKNKEELVFHGYLKDGML